MHYSSKSLHFSKYSERTRGLQDERYLPKIVGGGYFGVRHMQALLMFLALTIKFTIHGILFITLFFYRNEVLQEKSKRNFGLLISSFFIAHGVGTILSGYAAYKINNKFLLSSSVLVTTVLTYLTPLITNRYGASGFWTVIFLRGVVKALIFPVVCCQLSRWVPRSELNVTVPCVLSGAFIGCSFSLSLSKNLSQKGNWETAFYFAGNCSLVWLIAFVALGAQAPSSCWYISSGERTYIQNNVCCRTMSAVRRFVPFREIWKNVPSIALIITGSCNLFVVQNVLRIMVYIVYERHKNLNNFLADILSGGLMCFCTLLMFPMTYFVQKYIVKRNFFVINQCTQRFVLTSIGQWLLGSCLLLMVNAYSLSTSVIYSVIMYLSINILNMGLCVTAFDMSPNYVGIVMGWITGFASLIYSQTYFFTDLFEESYGKDISIRAYCALNGALCFLGNLCFTMFGSCHVQQYDFLEAFEEED